MKPRYDKGDVTATMTSLQCSHEHPTMAETYFMVKFELPPLINLFERVGTKPT